ncbi:TPA: hypothetical protein NIB68_005812, partial [Pseudomonas aeruginosa]|nr:hypothetical protein [Pseudomonas aeruginosa]
MADHHTRHNPLGQDALFTTPASLMLDARLTPLERNGWQVLRMLRSAEGISPLANLGQLRRYLTSTPLGQRAGYETARRVLVVLRLTGWISLVGQQRDPLTGHVLSELYQVHESALDFQQACTLDASLPALLQASIGQENNQVDRVAVHIQATLAQATEAASIATHDQLHDDDDLPPTPPSQASEAADPLPLCGDSAGSTLVPQQTEHARHMTAERGSTYKTYMYKKERRYRAREGDGDSASQPVSLPPCLSSAQADQQRDVQAALRRLPPHHRQEVLDELQARSQSGTVRNVVAYFFALVKRVFSGEFRLWAGRKEMSGTPRTAENRPADVPRTEHRP